MEESIILEKWENMGIPRELFAGLHCGLIDKEIVCNIGNPLIPCKDKCTYIEREILNTSKVFEIETKKVPMQKVNIASWPHLIPNPLFQSRPPRAIDFGVYSKTSGRQVLTSGAMYRAHDHCPDYFANIFERHWDPAFACLYLQGYATTERANSTHDKNLFCGEKLCNLLAERVFEIDAVSSKIEELGIRSMQVPALFKCGYGMVCSCVCIFDAKNHCT